MIGLMCKYAGEVLIPENGIGNGEEFRTSDGVDVRVRYISTWNNKDGAYDEELDDLCQRKWGVTFSSIRSVWFARLGRVGDFWHLVKMIKV